MGKEKEEAQNPDSSFPKTPYDRFDEFTGGKSRRFDVLKSILDGLKLRYSVMEFGEKRHFIVSPRKEWSSRGGAKKCGRNAVRNVFIAHYDALQGCEGANDNASGVFVLLCAAMNLRESAEDWTIIFTDKEEIKPGEGIRTQGSYILACVLKDTRLAGADFFIFDACGRGATIVISTLADYLIKKGLSGGAPQLKKKFGDLRNRAVIAAGRGVSNKVILMPTPFSDDAGFLAAGIAAQTITALPDSEAALFIQLSRSNPLYIKGLINRKFSAGINPAFLPETWRQLNSPADTKDKLDFRAAKGIIKLITALSKDSK